MERGCKGWLMVLMLGLGAGAVQAAPVDPLGSPMWDYLRERFLGADPYRFDERVRVVVPPFAEDPTQVPVSIDASALDAPVERILIWADLNPIQHIATLYPQDDRVLPKLSLRIKVQQATAVRAAALSAGTWYLGGAHLDASGGGCTVPSQAAANPYWESHLGEMQARRFGAQASPAAAARYKFRVIHPMDTGLVDGIPAFYIEQARLQDSDGRVLMRLELSPPVSENPVLSFDTRGEPGLSLWLRDNNGNAFETAVNREEP